MLNKEIFCLFFFIVYVLCGEDYYKLLGISRQASKVDVRKAFKKLALKYHPDKNKDKSDWAKTQFAKIANAYETLMDEEKRKIYDRHGEEGVQEHEQRQGSGRGGGSQEDIFQQFFGGGGGRRQHFQQEEDEEGPSPFVNSDVIHIKMDSLSRLYRRQEIWFMFFYKKEEKEFIELAKTLAEKAYGIFKVAGVNCKFDEEICEEFSVREFPSIVFFHENTGNEEEVYRGLKNFESIFNFGSKHMESFVRIINSGNYEDFSSESNSNLHKVILFNSRKFTPPLYKALSKQFKGKLSFGEIRQSDVEMVNKFEIKQFPCIFILTEPSTYRGVIYEGVLKKDHLDKFLSQYAYVQLKKTITTSVKEINNEVYNKQKMCNDNDSKNICVIFIENKNLFLSENDNLTLNNLAQKYINDPFKFYYVITNKYKNFWVSFDQNEHESTFIVIKGKRRRYYAYKGENIESLYEVLDNIVSGGGDFKQLNINLNFISNEEKKDL